MKKLLAIALCALMAVCAVVPALAADATLPELFEDADSINLGAIYEDVNAENEYVAGQKLFHFTIDDFAAWGFENMQGILPFAGCDYPVEFEVDEAGKYAIAVAMTGHIEAATSVAVKVCDEEGNVLHEEQIDHASTTPGELLYYTFSAELDLAADKAYTAYFSGINEGAGGNSIVCDFMYVLTEAADAGEDTSADAGEDTSADAGEDTSADAGNDDDVAPATFDAALIALAVAGASAAVAVVSKKRR